MIQNLLKLLKGKNVNRQYWLKSVVYRLYSVFITFLIAYAITGKLSLAAYIGMLDSVLKIFTYYVFDEAWDRATKFKADPGVIWLTGLPASGKTTIAIQLIKALKSVGIVPVLLDGDEIRNVMKLTAFDEASRKKHMLNVGQFASVLERQGNLVIVSLISPYKDVRDEIRTICNSFIEVYVSTPLGVCQERDPKGLYEKAIRGEITEFTGISAPYHAPDYPEISIDTSQSGVEQSTRLILNYIKK